MTMDTRILSGKEVSSAVYKSLEPRIESLIAKGIKPHAAAITLGAIVRPLATL